MGGTSCWTAATAPLGIRMSWEARGTLRPKVRFTCNRFPSCGCGGWGDVEWKEWRQERERKTKKTHKQTDYKGTLRCNVTHYKTTNPPCTITLNISLQSRKLGTVSLWKQAFFYQTQAWANSHRLPKAVYLELVEQQ